MGSVPSVRNRLVLGVKIGRAARQGYLDARSGQQGQRNGFP